MALTRAERFDRGDFQARDKVLQSRAEAERAAAVARGEASASSAASAAAGEDGSMPDGPPDNREHAEARAHLAELGYTESEIESLLAGPKGG